MSILDMIADKLLKRVTKKNTLMAFLLDVNENPENSKIELSFEKRERAGKTERVLHIEVIGKES